MDCKKFGHQFSLFSKNKYDEMDDLDGFENHFSTCAVCFGKYSERLSFERLLQDNWGELVVSDSVLKGKDKSLELLFDKDDEGEESIEACDKKFSTDVEESDIIKKIEKSLKLIGDIKKDEHMFYNEVQNALFFEWYGNFI